MNTLYKTATTLLAAFALIAILSVAASAQLTGTLDSSWDGVPATYVGYDPNAVISNFSAPEADSNNVAYNVYIKGDQTYFYGLLQTTGSDNGLSFVNAYLSTDPADGTNIAFSFGDTANAVQEFIPGGAGPVDASGLGILSAETDVDGIDTIEFAIPWTVFETDPLGLGVTPDSTAGSGVVEFRDTQSFGYSYIGGTSFGATRFGDVDVPAALTTPEPSPALPIVIAGVLLCGLALVGKRAAANKLS
jgi:hypothetical protein